MTDDDGFVEKSVNTTNQDDNHDWNIYLFAIFFVELYANFDFHKKWSELAKEISSVNRFNISHVVVDEIINRLQESPLKLPRGSVLYRARKMEHHALGEYISKIFSFVDSSKGTTSFEDILLSIAKWLSVNNDNDIESILASKGGKQFRDEFMKCNRSSFWGFNKKDSGAPPAEKTLAGRANPQGIRYLYTAKDPETALAEIRPTISEQVSIALLRTKKKLSIADLTSNQNQIFGANFSKVALGDEKIYLPIQYISERIKLSGFDGVQYKSSLHNDGINIVLFDPNSCKIVSSELRSIDKIIYESSKRFPFDHETEKLIATACSGEYTPLVAAISELRDELKKYFAVDSPVETDIEK
jgi:hypothetical protein